MPESVSIREKSPNVGLVPDTSSVAVECVSRHRKQT